MAARQGYQGYFLLAKQTAYDIPVTAPKKVIYEFAEGGISIAKQSAPIVPTRYTRRAAPIKNIFGRIGVAGGFNMHVHGDYMLPLYQAWFMDDVLSNISSVDGQCMTSSPDTPNVTTTPAAGASANKKTIPAGTVPITMSLDTQPNNTANPKLSPAKLKIESWDGTGVAKSSTAAVKITGTDQNNEAINETVTLVAGVGTSTKYFKTVDASGVSVTALGGLVANTDKLSFTAQKNIKLHVIECKDAPFTTAPPTGANNGLFPGFTMEVVKGNVPNRYEGILINNGNITLSPLMQFSFDVMGRTATLRKAINGSSATPTTLTSSYKRVPEEVFPNWGWSVQLALDGAALASFEVSSCVITLNNNLAHPDRYDGNATSLRRLQPQPQRNAAKEITVSCNVTYGDAPTIDFDAEFQGDRNLELRLAGFALPFGGPEYYMQFDAGRAYLTSYSDPQENTYGDLMQTLNFKIVPDTVSSPRTIDVGWDASGYAIPGSNSNPTIATYADQSAEAIPLLLSVQSTEADESDTTP